MARKSLADIQVINDRPKFLICNKCGRKIRTEDFYSHAKQPMGIIQVCKECIYKMVIDDNGVNRQGMIELLTFIDMPFIQSEFEDCIKKHSHYPKRAVAMYLTNVLRSKEYAELYFNDSIFTNDKTYNDEDKTQEERTQRFQELKNKWGNFDSIEYLERCEKLYVEIVQGGYVILSAMHDLSIRNYCKLQVDWDIAQETRDYNAMNQLKQPLKDARTDAKLNPSQFKAGDFQNGGANSFGEIARMVGKRDGFIPLPMKYFKQPNDQLDWMMLELVNYDRSILGLPEVTYEELYKHYIERIEKFNREYNADIENGDLGDLDEDTKGKKKHYTLI